MSALNGLMDMLKNSEEISQSSQEKIETPENNTSTPLYEIENIAPVSIDFQPFNIDEFTRELQEKSENKNQVYREAVQTINAYDISSGCIRDIIYKLTNTPVESFADVWLPVLLRSTLGSAVHEFIQGNTNQFTETEVSLKIPSIKMSVRLDALIGPSILVEIKSCTYSDYSKIITDRKPRISDFYQAMTYKYMLENYLEEAKNPEIPLRRNSKRPALDNYNIKQIQFIYVAHDITATDVESFGEAVARIKDLKKLLNSKSNSFFFMTTMIMDVVDNVANPYIDWIKSKIQYINYYLDNNLLPGSDDPFVDKKKCYFCLYRKICDL